MAINSAPVPTHPASDAGQSFCRPWRVSWFFPALAQVAGLTSFPAVAGRDLHARSQGERTKDAFRASWHESTTWGGENKRRLASRGYARSRPLPLRLALHRVSLGNCGPLAGILRDCSARVVHRANSLAASVLPPSECEPCHHRQDHKQGHPNRHHDDLREDRLVEIQH